MEGQESPATDLGETRRKRFIAILIIATIFFFFVLPVIGLALFFSGAYIVELDEVGVVLRMGEYDRIAEPGVNRKLPSPFEEVVIVPVLRQLKQEFGFRTVGDEDHAGLADPDVESESLMITGDLNLIEVQWIAQYRITDPVKYLFEVRSVTETFRDLNEAVMRAAVGDRSIDEVIVGRHKIEVEVTLHLQELCDHLETGIIVDQVLVQDVNPPEPVKPAFDDINKAGHERHRAIRDAQAASKQARAGGGS